MGSVALNIGLKALLTSQSALDTVGHNLSNANTPGYSRQNLAVSTSSTVMIRGLLQGNGVQADVVKRTVDDLLEKRLLQQTSVMGRLDARALGLAGAEALFGTGENAIEAKLRGLFASFGTLAGAPDDLTLRAGAVQSAVGLSTRFNQLSTGLLGLGQDSVARLKTHVSQVNQLTTQIVSLNKQISALEVGSTSANDLRDTRDQALRELAELVDTRVSENERGAVRVLVGGQPVVTATEAQKLIVTTASDGSLGPIRLDKSNADLNVTGGAIGGLIGLVQNVVPKLSSGLQEFAHQFILEANRAHSTGVSANGPYRQMVGASTLVDQDGDGSVADELLAKSGLPFDVTAGELYVNVTNTVTGQMTKHRIDIDPERTTAAQFLNALNAVGHLSASLDGQGRVRILADADHGFDFSARLDAVPDEIGSFGGARASLGTGLRGPFALSGGDTLDINGPSGPFTVTFNSGAFQQIGKATAKEVAAVINADPGAQANGIVASAVGNDVVLQTLGSGTGAGFTVTGGSALGAFGWSAGTAVAGHTTTVGVGIAGEYTGPGNDAWTFRPNMDGTVGQTQGLKIEVFDSKGLKITELDVGPGYTPGEEIDVLHGVRASFGLGQLSASNNDVMRLDVVADADTADVLPALGLNVLFTGSDATTMGVRKDLESNPTLLATSATGAEGDNGVLQALLGLDDAAIAGLDGKTFEEVLADLSGDVALDVASTNSARDAEQFLLDSLAARRDQVSGVNVDEELVHLIEFEQAFAAASQYIRVISDLNQELLNII